MNIAKQFKKELIDSSLMQLFEIEVYNIKDKENEHIICDLYIDEINNTMYVQRVGVSTNEENSHLIANNTIYIDDTFGLDEHLQSLLDDVQSSIIDGNLYELV